jgi:uncharacterized membrane protein
LIVAAFVVAAYLAWVSLRGGAPIGCGPDSGCDRVLRSRWAFWFGVPVSLLSLPVYAAFFAATLGVGRWVAAERQKLCWRILLSCAALIPGAAVWFGALQWLVLKSFCLFCMTAHVCGAGAAGLALLAALNRRAGPELPQADTAAGVLQQRGFAKGPLLAGAGGVVILALGQLVHQPKTYAIKTIAPAANTPPLATTNAALLVNSTGAAPLQPAQASAPARAEAPSQPQPAPPRLFPFYGGRFTVNVNDVPVIGSPTNRHVLVSLFDYTCHHCREMHALLLEAQRTFSNELVIVSLPMPLDPKCNSTVRATPPEHTNACEYARLGLMVWRAERSKHREFDDWLFAPTKPPPVPESRAYALRLVGPEAFAAASRDAWVEEQIKFSTSVYELAYRAGRGNMPQLIVSSNVALGTFPRNELFDLLTKSLGLARPP